MPPRRKAKRVATADATIGATTGDRNRISNKSEGKTTGARKLGGLKDMLEMPVDIISEITRHLHPRDLLSLSWSSKSLHKFFMRKGSKYMWKQSFQSLPWHLPIPEGIIEPAWATLLFTTVCTGCGTHTTDRDPIWEFNARFCVACATTKIIDSHDPLGDVLPRDKTHLAAHIPLAVFTPRRASFYHRTTYLRSEMQEIIDKWDILSNLGDEDALAMFIGKCILRVQRAPMHIARCEAWSEAHAQAVIAENTALEDKYLKAIVSRLRELGWGDELDHMQTCN
ncbi:hypothetical protein FOMPIDRAFT_1053786 [Fomitopsis schrenkii]|uniref:F-box domain-containing protein n=1 Tax=Fomitopsis schrenkii TaxID=2126942 RepID=S8FBF0_FOMSC|nr:hypothetical protein FOMPIDRAFT_1053786 [Fomitopsis schrenkii]